jgi:hypothetical protein
VPERFPGPLVAGEALEDLKEHWKDLYHKFTPPGVAEAFITAVESAVGGILLAPTQWRVAGMSYAVCPLFSTITRKQSRGGAVFLWLHTISCPCVTVTQNA